MMVDGDKLERTWKWVVVVYFKALSQRLLGQTEENHGKSFSRADHIAKWDLFDVSSVRLDENMVWLQASWERKWENILNFVALYQESVIYERKRLVYMWLEKQSN
jgi:hypothetical protein